MVCAFFTRQSLTGDTPERSSNEFQIFFRIFLKLIWKSMLELYNFVLEINNIKS